jgi:hypothetical protein
VVLPMSDFGNQPMQLVVAGALTTLMIQQMADVTALAAIFERRADDPACTCELCDEKPPAATEDEVRPLQEDFPAHCPTSPKPNCDKLRP